VKTTAGDVVRTMAFWVAFYGGTVLYVFVALAALAFGEQQFRAVVKDWSRWHRGSARRLLGIEIEIDGSIPERDVLIAIRHESFFEAIDLPMLIREPAIFAKAELLRIPLWGHVAGSYGLIPVERAQGAKALRHMLAAARSYLALGRPLAIFPEGTRVPTGTRAPLGAGFAGLYKLLGLPVVPVATNSGRLYHRRWKKGGVVTYRVGETIPPGLPRDEMERRVLDAIHALNEPD
jgi:1-acyl-sn-glycerol-3-phosphate acyltransferase